MKLLLFTFLYLISFTSLEWQVDFEKARHIAQVEHKFILLNFSGSDWCGPCIKMHEEIFDSPIFEEFAMGHLVLVKADFPRLKKHALTKEQQKRNEELAEMYNKRGIFPLTLLINPQGKIIRSWEGYPSLSAEQFTRELQTLIDGSK
jgi:thioredoxin-related protein